MEEFIEINYISPLTCYKFTKTYYLVVINTSVDNSVTIYKIHLTNIGNITPTIRSYSVNRAIERVKGGYPKCEFKLFEYDMTSKHVKLLFTCSINTNNMEYYNPQILELNPPYDILGNKRSCILNDDTSFLDERFFSYETLNTNEKCLLFITKVNKTDKMYVEPTTIKFCNLKGKFVYNRYYNNIMKELLLPNLDVWCLNNSYQDYCNYAKIAQLDLNKYLNPNQTGTFKTMFLRNIKPQLRKAKFSPYLNNVLLSPTDGRLTSIDNEDVFKKMVGLIPKPYEIQNGNGFINRSIASDYPKVFLPYAGNLTEIQILDNLITLKFTNEYFIPHYVHEREYISVLYGNNVNVSRGYPELVKVQPHNILIFYLVLIGDTITLTNSKLVNMKNIVGTNNNTKIKPFWMEQGEEIGVFNCCLGKTIFMTNRYIDFTADVKLYSGLTNPMECYIKTKDVVGLIL